MRSDSHRLLSVFPLSIRVVDNGGPADSITLLVDGCTFTDTQSEMDILLMDYRAGS